MTVVRGFGIVLVSTLLFGALGAGLGRLLGVVTPSYYRSLFRHGHEPWFDPEQIGLALGLTQGAATGVVVGIAVVGAVAWCDTVREQARERAALREESRNRE